jgi:hypothetical protein
MTMTRQEAAAKAREARTAKRQEAAEASGIAPTTYVYVGAEVAVLVEIDGSNYEFRQHAPVHLSHAVKHLDANSDFERVAE